MNPLLLPTLIDGVRDVLGRLFPDPTQRAAAELEMRKLEAEGTFDERARQALAIAQLEVNKAEASTDIFRGGWRPFVGWVCGAALAGQFVLGPILEWGFAAAGHPVPAMPRLDGVLWELLFGMLGLGTLRTVEKIKGKA